MIQVTINNKKYEVERPLTVPDVLTLIGLGDGNGIAIAVNDLIVSRSRWQNTIINDGDECTVFVASQGG